MPAGNASFYPFDLLLDRLSECHELSAYEAIERLVQTAEAVGFDVDALVRMLDQGTTFEELLEAVELKIELNAENRRTAA